MDLLAIAIDRLLADCLLHDTSFADCLLTAFGVRPTRARERELARYSDPLRAPGERLHGRRGLPFANLCWRACTPPAQRRSSVVQ